MQAKVDGGCDVVHVTSNGLEIMVPLFIETGGPIRVDTELRKYVGRQSADKGH